MSALISGPTSAGNESSISRRTSSIAACKWGTTALYSPPHLAGQNCLSNRSKVSTKKLASHIRYGDAVWRALRDCRWSVNHLSNCLRFMSTLEDSARDERSALPCAAHWAFAGTRRRPSSSVAVFPITLQREFARRVTAVEKLKTAQRASLAESDALFASLQHRPFRGNYE